MKIKKDGIAEILTNCDCSELFNSIPNQMGEVLKLFYCMNFSQIAITKKLNLSKGMVQQHLSKGKYLIKKKFGDQKYKRAFDLLYKSRDL
jgi:DNA-directed RNA polymerase specialized sigma24 family protein